MSKKNKTVSNPNQLELSLPDLEKRILEREPQIELGRKATMFQAAKTIELVIEQGKDLIAAKKLVGHGKWLEWVKQHLPISHDTANRYMKLASNYANVRNLESDMSIRQAMLAAGLIPENQSDSKQLPSISVSPIVSRLNFVAEWVTKSADEIQTWEEIRRQELKLQLKPVVELFEKL